MPSVTVLMNGRGPKAIGAGVWALVIAACAQAQTGLRLVTDRASYNVGAEVSVRFAPPAPGKNEGSRLHILAEIAATVRYAGEERPIEPPVVLPTDLLAPGRDAGKKFAKLWRVPADARTGRYEIDLQQRDARTHQILSGYPGAASFNVYRKLVRISEVRLDQTFYTSGDPVSANVTLENLTDADLAGLRVEFSNRYWPWIAGPAEAAKASIATIAQALELPPRGSKQLRAERVEVAPVVKQPSTQQYGVVVWDRNRRTVLDICFSPLAFVHPPGVDSPVSYPGQYAYSQLGSLKTASYRHFYPQELDSPVIRFEHGHTMFPSGSEAEVRFSVSNPTAITWHNISARVRLLDWRGNKVAEKTAIGAADLDPASPVSLAARFTLPSHAGLYRAVVEVRDATAHILAESALQLGINPMPRSVLVFCAHEDDEGGYSGLTRAAVENHIPIRFVYFTSGDAGSCDRYYEHSCSPPEATNFGTVRMEEVRASLGHLGVPREAIRFVGLPDGGSGAIWYDHPNPSNPFLDPLLGADHAPYADLVSPNLPYSRELVVRVVKQLIREFQPEIICTAHPPSVGHIDHIVNNYLVVKALQELLREGAISSRLILLVDRVYDPKEQPKTPYHYGERGFYVSGEAAALAQEAGWFYQSQGGTHGQVNLRDFGHLARREVFRQILDWNEHEGWNERR